MGRFLEKNITAVTAILERTIASERWVRRRGLLQRIDPRVKLPGIVLLVIMCSLTKSIPFLISLYMISIVFALLSRINIIEFLGRVWIFIPLFSGIIALPALFLTPGGPLFSLGPLTVTREGAITALFLVLRVSTSVSFTVLLILTTSWNAVLDALRSLKVPAMFVSLLSISYRYLLLLLRSLSELLLARKSRVITTLPFRRELRFITRSSGYLFLRSLHLAEGIQMAMASRGYVDPASFAPGGGGAGTFEEAHGNTERAHGNTHGENAFEMSVMRYTYPDGVPGVRIDKLEIASGACTILLGPNGSGKSTLLKILDGLVSPQEGELRAFGEAVTESRLNDTEFQKRFRSRVGLIFQDADIQCFSPTVRDELSFGPLQKGLSEEAISRRVENAMKLLRLESIADRYPYRLSSGEKKRVAIASVVTVDPDVYLMDEPTANLDPATEGILIDLLADLSDRGKTLVIATQDLLLARHIGTRAIVLGPEQNLIATGPALRILENHALLEKAGLVHAHRAPHGTVPTTYKHTHYTREEER